MSSPAKKGAEGSKNMQNMQTRTATASTSADTEDNMATSSSVAPVKSGAMRGREIGRHRRKQPVVPTTSSLPVNLGSVSNVGMPLVMTPGIAAEEMNTAVQRDASCVSESRESAAADISPKLDRVGSTPSASYEILTAARSTSPEQRGSNQSTAPQVADIYEALLTLSPSQDMQPTRQKSIEPFTTFLGRAEPSSSNDNSPGNAARSRSNGQFEVKVAAATLLILIILTSTFLLYPKPKPQRIHKFCTTKGCETHRYWIKKQLDIAIDPCDDFGAHVCRRWMPRKHLSCSELSHMYLYWLYKLPETLSKGVVHFPVGKKVAAMFHSCMTEKGSQIHIIKEFMRERGIIWPETPGVQVYPSEALFDLSLNWNVHLWFTMKILPAISKEKPRRIFLSPNNLMLLWKAMINQIPKEYFQRVYAELLKIFSNDTSSEPDVERMLDTYKMLQHVFNTLVPSSPPKARFPGSFYLGEIDSSPNSIAKGIMNLLNTVMAIDPPFTMDDLMLVSDVPHFANIMALTGEVSDKSLERHLSWLFVLAHAAVAFPAAVLLVFHGSKHRVEEERPRFCASQIEPSYKLLIAAMASAVHFSEDERRRIVSHLEDVVQVAVEKTWASSWLDNETKHFAAAKLTSVRTVVWPSDKFFTAKTLEEVYENFTDTAASFVEYWIQTRRSQRLMYGTEAAEQELLLGDNTQLPYVEYVHLLNRLSVALGALAPPLYYRDGTNAMLHGGILYLYARELIKSIDNEGLEINQQGEFLLDWLSEVMRDTLKNRTQSCLPKNVSIFPEVPAMEVAYEAFKRNVNQNEAQLTPDLTEEKVFFITACLSSCAVTPADNLFGGDCNKAVMNFAPFAKAFGCPVGSNMNPATKCTFYD